MKARRKEDKEHKKVVQKASIYSLEERNEHIPKREGKVRTLSDVALAVTVASTLKSVLSIETT